MTEEEEELQLCRVLKECKTLAKLKHPNIVKLAGIVVDESERMKGIVTELILPGSLGQLIYQAEFKKGLLAAYGRHDGQWLDPLTGQIDTKNPLPELFILEVLQNVYQGLYYLHGRDPVIVHRDLTPATILIELFGPDDPARQGRLKRALIGDLGGTRLQQQQQQSGRSPYLAPEFQTSGSPCTGAVDIFSMGVVAIELSNGRPPSTLPPSQSVDGDVVTQLEHRKADLDAIAYPLIRQLIAEPSVAEVSESRPTASQLLNTVAKLVKKSHRKHILPEFIMEDIVVTLQGYNSSPSQLEDSTTISEFRRICYRLKHLFQMEGKEGDGATKQYSERFLCFGGLEALYLWLKSQIGNVPVILAGLQVSSALASIAPADSEQRSLVDATEIELCLDILRSHGDNPYVQAQTCHNLSWCARNNTNRKMIGREGGITAVIAAMTSNRSNPGLQTHACEVLRNLALKSLL